MHSLKNEEMLYQSGVADVFVDLAEVDRLGGTVLDVSCTAIAILHMPVPSDTVCIVRMR